MRIYCKGGGRQVYNRMTQNMRLAYLCEDFDTFITEISEWGVDHIGGVDFDDPEVNRGMMDAYFASFGCTPDDPHPCSKYASGVLS